MTEERKVIISLKEYESLKSGETEKVKWLKRDIEELKKENRSTCVITITKTSPYSRFFHDDIRYHVLKGQSLEQCDYIKNLIDERNKLAEKCEDQLNSLMVRADRIEKFERSFWYKLAKLFGSKI
jgi:hypothetical protein